MDLLSCFCYKCYCYVCSSAIAKIAHLLLLLLLLAYLLLASLLGWMGSAQFNSFTTLHHQHHEKKGNLLMVVSMKARQFTAFQFNERLPIAKKWMNEATDA
jgi:hypothetical protein